MPAASQPGTVPELTVRIKKGRDGPHSLVCQRADGTMTMQHHPTTFFPLHDLIHYAVETVLGHERGFYGLVASGWNLNDFGTPWPRGKLPPDLDPSELIVVELTRGMSTREPVTAQQINANVAAWYAQNLPDQPLPTTLSDQQLERVRSTIEELHAHWRAMQPGGTLELHFPVRHGRPA